MTDLTAIGLPLDNTADTATEQYDPAHDYHALNAMLNLYDADGKIQFDKDKAAEREYVTGHVATNSKRFASTAERLEYLISNQYYNPAVFNQYSAEFLDRIYEHVESAGFEFGTFLGAFKFYTSYALKTFDGPSILRTSRNVAPLWPWSSPPAMSSRPSNTPTKCLPAASSPPPRPS